VYVYTNSRVLNQNALFTYEAATEWYKQSIISNDSDSEGPTDLFDDYDDVFDFDTPGVLTDNENIQGQLQEQDGLQLQGLGIREDGWDLQDSVAQNVIGPHAEAPREHKQSLPPANSISGDASLNTNHILHGGQKGRIKRKSPMKSSKIPGLLQLHRARRWHPRSTLCLTMIRLLSIQLPPSTTSALFKLLMIEIPHIALCFQAGLMGLTRKEMHLFRAWKILTCSM
jgi:hypothetical protein